MKRLLVTLALVAARCGFLSTGAASGKIIDGWDVGQPFDCGIGT